MDLGEQRGVHGMVWRTERDPERTGVPDLAIRQAGACAEACVHPPGRVAPETRDRPEIRDAGSQDRVGGAEQVDGATDEHGAETGRERETEEVDGLLSLIDALQDFAVDVLGVPESEVFSLEGGG